MSVSLTALYNFPKISRWNICISTKTTEAFQAKDESNPVGVFLSMMEFSPPHPLDTHTVEPAPSPSSSFHGPRLKLHSILTLPAGPAPLVPIFTVLFILYIFVSSHQSSNSLFANTSARVGCEKSTWNTSLLQVLSQSLLISQSLSLSLLWPPLLFLFLLCP